MSFRECLERKVKDGLIDGKRTDEILEMFEENYQRKLDKGMEEADASREAAEETVENANFQKIQKKRQNLLHAKRLQELLPKILNYKDGTDTPNPGLALTALFDFDPHGKATYKNIAKTRDSYSYRYKTQLQQLFNEIDWSDDTNVIMRDVVRGLYGEDVNDPVAKKIADKFQEISQIAFNEARLLGSTIAERGDWNLPNFRFKWRKVKDVGRQEWKQDMLEAIDEQRVREVIETETGQMQDVEMVLDSIYDNIVSEGKLSSKKIDSNAVFADKQSVKRIFQYATADDWLRIQDKYGKGPIFDSMVNYLDGLAKDNAVMDVLGPKPEAMYNTLKRAAGEHAGKLQRDGEMTERYLGMYDDDPVKTFESFASQADSMWDVIQRGTNNVNNGLLGSLVDFLRNMATAAFLGKATLIASTDLNYGRLAAKFNGLSQTKTLGRMFKNQMPFSGAEDMQRAKQMALVSDATNALNETDGRWAGWIGGNGRWMADGVLKISLLNRWTRRNRMSFNMEFMGKLARMSDKRWSELAEKKQDKIFRETLENYGIGKREWNKAVYDADISEEQGVNFLKPQKDLRTDELGKAEANAIGKRLHEMILTEQDYAVPTSSLRARSSMTREKPGLLKSLVKAGTQFLTFPVTMHQTHITRAMMQTDGFTGKGSYFANMVIGSTLMAGMAIQAESVLEGKDPVDPTEKPVQTFTKALMRGGAMGPWGDLLFGGSSRGGMVQSLTGPVLDMPKNTFRTAKEGAKAAYGSRDSKFGRTLTNYLKKYTPGSNLFYAELAFERMLFDKLQQWADPQAARSFQRDMSWAKETSGQDYWWEPGETTPDRSPDLSKGVGVGE